MQTRKKPKSPDVVSIFSFVCYDIVFKTLFLSKIHMQCNSLLSNWNTNRMEFHRLKVCTFTVIKCVTNFGKGLV